MITMLRVLPAALALALIVGCEPHAAAQERDSAWRSVSQYPLVGDHGQPVANHAVTLEGPIDQLPGVVSVGNPRGKTALVEFYDLNCPFCRIASVDIGDLVDTDPDLKLVLVPYPVLGPASVAASRVELAVAKLGTPRQFYEFHRRIYAQYGTTDGLRALAVAGKLGFDQRALSTLGDSAEITQIMKAHLALGSALGLTATPAFILGHLAILGYPGRESLQAMVEAADRCGKPMCSSRSWLRPKTID
jgi:protein-disulfide isomerase